ncbi:hypothetical protein HY230_06140 [Candidatus Acetothermia bacterium]|nr:hypothetical protein [Candidatus Acetothermia bacterium]
MAEELTIRDPAVARLLMNEAKQAMLELCVREPRSIDQLSKILKKNPGAIHYHLQPLLKHKLLKLHSTRRARGITEKRYIATAKRFYVEVEAGQAGSKATTATTVFRRVTQLMRRLERSAAEEAFIRDRPILGYRLKLHLSPKTQREVVQAIQKLVKHFSAREGSSKDPFYGLAIGFGPMKEFGSDDTALNTKRKSKGVARE